MNSDHTRRLAAQVRSGARTRDSVLYEFLRALSLNQVLHPNMVARPLMELFSGEGVAGPGESVVLDPTAGTGEESTVRLEGNDSLPENPSGCSSEERR